MDTINLQNHPNPHVLAKQLRHKTKEELFEIYRSLYDSIINGQIQPQFLPKQSQSAPPSPNVDHIKAPTMFTPKPQFSEIEIQLNEQIKQTQHWKEKYKYLHEDHHGLLDQNIKDKRTIANLQIEQSKSYSQDAKIMELSQEIVALRDYQSKILTRLQFYQYDDSKGVILKKEENNITTLDDLQKYIQNDAEKRKFLPHVQIVLQLFLSDEYFPQICELLFSNPYITFKTWQASPYFTPFIELYETKIQPWALYLPHPIDLVFKYLVPFISPLYSFQKINPVIECIQKMLSKLLQMKYGFKSFFLRKTLPKFQDEILNQLNLIENFHCRIVRVLLNQTESQSQSGGSQGEQVTLKMEDSSPPFQIEKVCLGCLATGIGFKQMKIFLGILGKKAPYKNQFYDVMKIMGTLIKQFGDFVLEKNRAKVRSRGRGTGLCDVVFNHVFGSVATIDVIDAETKHMVHLDMLRLREHPDWSANRLEYELLVSTFSFEELMTLFDFFVTDGDTQIDALVEIWNKMHSDAQVKHLRDWVHGCGSIDTELTKLKTNMKDYEKIKDISYSIKHFFTTLMCQRLTPEENSKYWMNVGEHLRGKCNEWCLHSRDKAFDAQIDEVEEKDLCEAIDDFLSRTLDLILKMDPRFSTNTNENFHSIIAKLCPKTRCFFSSTEYRIYVAFLVYEFGPKWIEKFIDYIHSLDEPQLTSVVLDSNAILVLNSFEKDRLSAKDYKCRPEIKQCERLIQQNRKQKAVLIDSLGHKQPKMLKNTHTTNQILLIAGKRIKENSIRDLLVRKVKLENEIEKNANRIQTLEVQISKDQEIVNAINKKSKKGAATRIRKMTDSKMLLEIKISENSQYIEEINGKIPADIQNDAQLIEEIYLDAKKKKEKEKLNQQNSQKRKEKIKNWKGAIKAFALQNREKAELSQKSGNVVPLDLNSQSINLSSLPNVNQNPENEPAPYEKTDIISSEIVQGEGEQEMDPNTAKEEEIDPNAAKEEELEVEFEEEEVEFEEEEESDAEFFLGDDDELTDSDGFVIDDLEDNDQLNANVKTVIIREIPANHRASIPISPDIPGFGPCSVLERINALSERPTSGLVKSDYSVGFNGLLQILRALKQTQWIEQFDFPYDHFLGINLITIFKLLPQNVSVDYDLSSFWITFRSILGLADTGDTPISDVFERLVAKISNLPNCTRNFQDEFLITRLTNENELINDVTLELPVDFSGELNDWFNCLASGEPTIVRSPPILTVKFSRFLQSEIFEYNEIALSIPKKIKFDGFFYVLEGVICHHSLQNEPLVPDGNYISLFKANSSNSTRWWVYSDVINFGMEEEALEQDYLRCTWEMLFYVKEEISTT